MEGAGGTLVSGLRPRALRGLRLGESHIRGSTVHQAENIDILSQSPANANATLVLCQQNIMQRKSYVMISPN